MLSASGAALPEGEPWSYEIKWDGYRAIAINRGDLWLLKLRRGEGGVIGVWPKAEGNQALNRVDE
jgi:hypothetical protein